MKNSVRQNTKVPVRYYQDSAYGERLWTLTDKIIGLGVITLIMFAVACACVLVG